MSHQELNNRGRSQTFRTPTQLIMKLFKEYYRKAEIKLPKDFALREFAIQPFGSDTYIRHLAFRTIDDIKSYIQSKIPKHFYYSSAKYENPGLKDMESKKWLGSDLVFDIDTDHIPGCKEVKYWKCPKGHIGQLVDDIKSCPVCGEKIEKVSLVDDECVLRGLEETIKLVDVLMEDLGFTKDKIKVYFSGHRGYHVHVELGEDLALLSSDARREIVDYIIGLGLDLQSLKLVDEKHGRTKYYALLPRIDDYGWRRRIARILLYDLIKDSRNDKICKYISNEEPPSPQTIITNVGLMLEEVVDKSRILIDEKVTIDIHRLIRVPGSLNGKTGLLVVELDVSKLDKFKLSIKLSPFKEEAIFQPWINVKDITLLGNKLNLSKNTPIRMSLGLAVYLALKDLGEIKKII